MKNTIIILLALMPFLSFSQVDSAAVKINVSVQARDCEVIASFISHRELYEDLFDAIKKKFRVANPPGNTTIVAIDSVSVGTWILVSDILRKDYISIQANAFSRIDALLRAKNVPYLTRILNQGNQADIAHYQTIRAIGRQKLRRVNN